MSRSVTREIVTFQFGHYANFVGTHWWNTQSSSFVYHPSNQTGPKEVNSDVLFRVGENFTHEVTYTPRLVVFDLKGSLNTLKETGTLYDHRTSEDDAHWVGDVTFHKFSSPPKNEFLQDLEHEEALERAEKSNEFETEKEDERETDSSEQPQQVFGRKFYDLDDSVVVWSDYLRLHFHPKTMEIIRNYQHNNELETFDVFGYGVNVYKEQQQEIEDRLHFFAEECDSLEGFLLMVDTYNAFGGLASSFMEDVSDDYHKKSVMIYSVTPPTFPAGGLNEEQCRLINLGLSYEMLLPNSSIFLPLSVSNSLWKQSGSSCQLPYLQYKPFLPYHSSAVLAASIDTMTLPFRLEREPVSLTDMADMLTPFGKKLVPAFASLPLPISESGSLQETLSLTRGGSDLSQLLHSLTPFVPEFSQTPDSQYLVCRGIDSTQQQQQWHHPLDTGAARPEETPPVNDILLSQLERVFKTTLNSLSILRQPCKVTSPYPHIFSPNIAVNGCVSSHKRPPNQGVHSVPAMTMLQSSSTGKSHLSELCSGIGKVKLHKLQNFLETGLELDQLNEMLESLQHAMRCYDLTQMDMN